jgi:hypothetical protein
LDRWQQQPDQNTDDGNHHQQLHQRKRSPFWLLGSKPMIHRINTPKKVKRNISH